jgi:hypothetical protein
MKKAPEVFAFKGFEHALSVYMIPQDISGC